MSRIAYVDGRYLPLSEAAVSIQDRAVQFADGVYEVIEVRDSHLIDERGHLARLHRSLDALQMRHPMNARALEIVMRETVRRNRVRDGLVYLQVTRGSAPREFYFPDTATPPTLIITARHAARAGAEAAARRGVAVITVPDIRWKRVDIKSTALLPNALAKEAARQAGAKEAWLVDADGYVTEGSSSNAWIVTREGVLVTRPAETGILRGITRTTLIEVLARERLTLEERRFTVEEAKAAREAFFTAATALVMPVISIDGTPIGNGAPGLVASRLRAIFHDTAERTPV